MARFNSSIPFACSLDAVAITSMTLEMAPMLVMICTSDSPDCFTKRSPAPILFSVSSIRVLTCLAASEVLCAGINSSPCAVAAPIREIAMTHQTTVGPFYNPPVEVDFEHFSQHMMKNNSDCTCMRSDRACLPLGLSPAVDRFVGRLLTAPVILYPLPNTPTRKAIGFSGGEHDALGPLSGRYRMVYDLRNPPQPFIKNI